MDGNCDEKCLRQVGRPQCPVLQGAAGQPFTPRELEPCIHQSGRCFPGICCRPYYWIGTCQNGRSCCRRCRA
uniref:Beta-defensin-like domain-containing protein n=1 Tax=Falco tinnunculus TaxID=100819 RepID=A0A8C4UD31_FALTI